MNLKTKCSAMDPFCITFMPKNKCECLENICSCDSNLVAVLHKFEETKSSIVSPNFLSVKASHIKVTKISNTVCVVDSSKLISVVVNVNFDDKSENYLLCEVPNLKESEFEMNTYFVHLFV